MSVISINDAQDLIMKTFKAFSSDLRRNRYNSQGTYPQLSHTLNDWERILARGEFPNELFKDFDAESYNYLLDKCHELADLYQLPTRNELEGKRVVYPQSFQMLYAQTTEPYTRTWNNNELNFVIEILGSIGERAYRRATIYRIQEGRSGSTSFFHKGQIWLETSVFQNPLNSPESRNTFIHEVFHQAQYLLVPPSSVPVPGLGTGAFVRLIEEQLLYNNKQGTYVNVYDYGDLTSYRTLADMPYLEAQAQMVGDFAGLYYRANSGNGISPDEQITIRRMAEILRAQGINSKAVRWGLRNY